MLRSRTIFAALVLWAMPLGARWASAQDIPSLTDPVVGKLDQRVTRFLEGVSADDPSAAFADLLLGSQLAQQEAAVRALVDKSKEIAQRYGAHQGSEQISARRIGKDVVLLKYLFKCERFPVIWYFAFYRDFTRPAGAADDAWVVIAVRFDTQMEPLFD